jgi:hypothetical protein
LELIPNSAIGTFNYGHSYLGAARALFRLDWEQKETHSDSPIEFLFWHSIELFLKSFLLAEGLSEKELRVKPYGHNIQELWKASSFRGLRLSVKDAALLSYMPDTDSMIELRYLKVGVKTVPDIEEIEETSLNIYRTVGAELQARGIKARVY